MNRTIALLVAAAAVTTSCNSGNDESSAAGQSADGAAPSTTDSALVEIEATPSQLDVGDLEPGSYEFDFLGTGATITTGAPWFVPIAQDSVVILEDSGRSAGSDGQALLLLRPTGFLSDGDIQTGYVDVSGPTDDIDAWIDLVSFDVEDRVTTEVAGHPTDVITGTAPGGGDTFLRTNAPLPFNGTPDGDYIYVRATSRYRIWLIDQGEFDPIVALAIADLNDDGEWLTVADTLIDTLTLGEPAAHPNPPAATECVEAVAETEGAIQLATYGGLRLVADVPIDVSSMARFPRTEINLAGTPVVGFVVLGPLDESPDYTDAASARTHVLAGRAPAAEPVLEGFGSEAVGAIIDPDATGGTGTPKLSLGDGVDSGRVSQGDAFWFFDTEQGVFLVKASPDGQGELDPALDLLSSIVPTMELVDGLCD